MIQISLTTAIVFYSAILGLLISIIWVLTEVGVRRSHRFLAKQFLWRCVFCRYSYLDEDAQEISKCPRCGSLNSITDEKAREIRSKMFPHYKAAQEKQQDDVRRNPSRHKRPGQKKRGPRSRR